MVAVLSMFNEKPSAQHRRGFLKGVALGGAAFLPKGLFGPSTARAQTPPNCPPAPLNGTPFRAGQDTRPIVQRHSISSMTSSQVAQLRSAFAKLRALPSTDKRGWVIQADMHALYCQACNYDTLQSVHGSWNFFPWHRAFLYYFERILGSLVGDISYFRLPYWDWENHRSIPSAYLSPANSTNSLYDASRYSVIASGGSLPTNDGTAARISLLNGITDFKTFGGTATAGGACESNPHDPVHDDVGLHTSPWHDMGHLGFAARDPIFYAHHCNIDKLWAHWNARASTAAAPAYRNPTDSAFLSERWNFYDENQKVVSMSAADVLNYTSNLRFTYPSSTSTASVVQPASPYRTASLQTANAPETAPLVTVHAAKLNYSGNTAPALEVTYNVKTSILQAVSQQSLFVIILRDVTLPENAMGVFDVMSARGGMKYLGTLAVVADVMRPMPKTVVLDATEAAADLLDTSNPARIILVPREGNGRLTFKAEDLELRVLDYSLNTGVQL
jgi:hypothetical protein